MTWATSLTRMTEVVRDTFPCAATLSPRAGGSYAITLVFDEAHTLVTPDADGIPVSTTEPLATVRLADLPVVPRVYDSLVIGATTYRIARVAPDGSGMAGLSLEEV